MVGQHRGYRRRVGATARSRWSSSKSLAVGRATSNSDIKAHATIVTTTRGSTRASKTDSPTTNSHHAPLPQDPRAAEALDRSPDFGLSVLPRTPRTRAPGTPTLGGRCETPSRAVDRWHNAWSEEDGPFLSIVLDHTPSVLNPCFSCDWRAGVVTRGVGLSQPCRILVGDRKAPSGPCLGTDRTGLGSRRPCDPGRGVAGRVSAPRRRRPGVGPTGGEWTGVFRVLGFLGDRPLRATEMVSESENQATSSDSPWISKQPTYLSPLQPHL